VPDRQRDPRRRGIELRRNARANGHAAPIILLSDKDNLNIDAQATEIGVSDCLERQRLTPARLERAIRYALEPLENRANR